MKPSVSTMLSFYVFCLQKLSNNHTENIVEKGVFSASFSCVNQ